MRLLAPAKINLHLRVGPPRGDGFHPLLSWFCTTGLFDKLMLESDELDPETRVRSALSGAPQGSENPVITLACDDPNVPGDERNLVVKVALAFAEEAEKFAGAEVRPVRATLNKCIPAGAGLGGGSSDGARALLGLNVLWKARQQPDWLSRFAARFGSDLSFFFHGASSVCRGRGEIVQPIGRPMPRWVLLVLPTITMPTPDVYRRFDALRLGREDALNNEPDWRTWATLDAQSLLPRLVNDLERPAFDIAPNLASLREELEKKMFRPVRMSGSGSSLFTLFDAEGEARHSKRLVESAFVVRAEAVELAPAITDDLNALGAFR